jgi:hypothetical protein
MGKDLESQYTESGHFWFNIILYVKEFTLFCREICVSYYYSTNLYLVVWAMSSLK